MSKLESQQPLTCLPSDMAAYLNDECLVMLSSIDKESNTPMVSTISWVKSRDETNIRFAVASNSRVIQNIRANPVIDVFDWDGQRIFHYWKLHHSRRAHGRGYFEAFEG